MRSMVLLLLCCMSFSRVLLPGAAEAQRAPRLPGELSWAIAYDPKSFDPAKVDDQESELVRYLTGGVLLRFNRSTEKMDGQLAESWNLSADGKIITFKLRSGLRFSDGSPLTSKDAVFSLQRVLLPATGAPVAEEFLTPADVKVTATDDRTVVVRVPQRVIGVERFFDEIAIEPFDQNTQGRVTSGPFFVADYRRSQYVRLKRNAYFHGRDSSGAALPYAAGVLLEIVDNPEQELRLFLRGEYDLIQTLAPDYFEVLKKKMPAAARDLGPSLNTEQIWFNQALGAPIPDWEKRWFQNQGFRVAVSRAIKRSDLARIAYAGHATPAYSFISPTNQIWYNSKISVAHEDVAAARSALASAGFRLDGSVLKDAGGHPVRFSILTNAGNASRLKMATLIQQDLSALGMQVQVVPLDFPALIERLMHTQDYEACLLGLENVDIDPNAMMNIWSSSSANHQWNPSEKTPATLWEAEIDRQMHVQATSLRQAERKQAIDRVQQIVADQQPFIYLVYPNVLYAISPKLRGVQPVFLQPGLIWNAERLTAQQVGR
jgi:peptide/nickel transport system substrate-binding protein